MSFFFRNPDFFVIIMPKRCNLSLALLLFTGVLATCSDAFLNEISTTCNVHTSTCLYSSVPQSKNKKNKKRKNNKKGTGESLTVDALSEHVSERYMLGRGGPLDGKTQKRGIFDSNTEQADFLKKLNNHPALVLNADFQVC